MKTCSKCKKDKPLTEFHKNRSRPDGHQGQCKPCKAEVQKQWYEKNKARHVQNVQENKKRTIRENVERLQEMGLSCHDCGEDEWILLDFDHDDRLTKTKEVSRFIAQGYSWARIEEEIKKCTVRCVSCHRKRTAEQLGWYQYLEGEA